MSDLKLSVLISAIDEFSAPARKVAKVSESMTGALGKGQQSLQKLGKEKQAIDRLKTLEQRLGKTAADMDQARQSTARLGRELAASTHPTKKLNKQFESARRQSGRLKDQHQKQRQELQVLRQQLRGAGMDTRRLGDAQNKIAGQIRKTTQTMERMGKVEAGIARARSNFDLKVQRAAGVALIAGGAGYVAQRTLRMMASPINNMRTVERSRGELASLGVQDIDAVTRRGQQMANQLAGINTAAFVSAAYDIKSGISTLSDKGIADMTALAALTAKATKADVGLMTSLFATGYGSFKNSLFKEVNDSEFGEIFSAMLSKSVQQFKTDGSKMQQAIQSMGSGLAESGIALSTQLTALGMLQQKMEAGSAGTTLNALERSAGQAQERFERMGLSIQTLDEHGNLRDLPDILEAVQQAFGEEYTTETGALLQKGFGSEEAVKFFKALWGQQEVFRQNAQALKAAKEQGQEFTLTMAKAMDNNMDARMQLMQQRFSVIKEKLGYALIPILEKIIPFIEIVANGLSDFIENNSGLSRVLVTVVGAVAGLTLIIAPVLTALASFGAAIAYIGYTSKKAQGSKFFGALGGGRGKKGGLLRRAGRALGGKVGLIGAGMGALSIGATLADDGMSGKEKAADVTNSLGSIGGALGGAKLGATMGSIVPGIGTLIGGALGAITGGIAGNWLGDKVGSWIDPTRDDAPSTTKPVAKTGAAAAVTAALVAAPAMASPTPTTAQHTTIERIQIHQQPGENADALADKILEKINDQQRYNQQGAQYDE
ncbi:MAG: phage tail tape measure protein [Endozoicomonas sp. (ex Botrylloides leachii)]|nr:phage tail tape measure protein [Endozoicomonas sp. (ex Botrylloides leachii)]